MMRTISIPIMIFQMCCSVVFHLRPQNSNLGRGAPKPLYYAKARFSMKLSYSEKYKKLSSVNWEVQR